VEGFSDQRRSAVRLGSSRSGHLEDARQFIDALRAKDASEAVPKLIEVLGDESWYLRERAGDALVGFGAPAAPALEELLRAGLWYSRAAALQALGRIAAPRSLLAVAGFLSDPNLAIAQESGRALFGYCRRGGAIAVAKLLHARGPIQRDRALALLRQIDADGAGRLTRLIETPALMGPEGSLTADEQARVALSIRDDAWGIDWEQLGHGEPLPEWREDLVRHLREGR
jgi:HEAT repeat protein